MTENFIAAQTYPSGTPAIGFEAPVMYQMGNSGHYDNYFRDVQCGNTASPAAGPDGDAAQTGWDAATGWGAPDWFNYSTGYALTLGATNLSLPPSLARGYLWSCARTPGNSSERGLSCPSSSVCYAVGTASGATPWYAKFLSSGAWGAVNTFYKSTDGGQTWEPSNGDMTSIACTSASSCIEVGDGGRIKTTADSGTTWSDAASPFDKALTQVRCPSSSVCYAVGDRGTALKSTDGGATWSFLTSVDGNPIYGLACPSTNVCYATDIYAHIMKTSDGGASWTMQRTPVTTPGLAVPGSGGPNPFSGLFGISCSDESTCVAVGGFPPTGTDPPIVTTTDGGATWTLRTSNSGSGNYLHAVTCLPGSTTCYAVGRGGSIVTTSDLVTWTKMTSGVTTMLDSVTCPSASFCLASGQGGTIDTFNGSTWTPTTGLGGGVFLAGVTCLDTANCYAAGKQGVTIATTNGGISWNQQAGGGTTQQMNSVSCADEETCVAVGQAGTILQTTNGGQTWLPHTSGTTRRSTASPAPARPRVRQWVPQASRSQRLTERRGHRTPAGRRTPSPGVLPVGHELRRGRRRRHHPRQPGRRPHVGRVDERDVGRAQRSRLPSGICYATGAVVSGNAVMLGSTDSGATWTPQASNSVLALSGIACVDDLDCFAGGAIGTVVATHDGGVTWAQQGNPISGPVTAPNAGPTGITAIFAAACNSTRCLMGTASSGNIMTTPLLTVTVNSSSPYLTTPNLSGLAPNDPAITYSPAGQAGSVTGTLTCSTTADNTSHVRRVSDQRL